MTTPLFCGCGVALVTPFRDGQVDLPALDRLVDFQLAGGADAIIACGTTGEPSTLTDAEWALVLSRVVERVARRVPVVAGTGGNDTAHVIACAARAKALGADAQLCVTPYYNKTTQAGLIAHFCAIADQSELPVIIYNVPSRTGLNLLPATLARIAPHENVIGVKEASADMAQVARMMALAGNDVAFYCGTDEIALPMLVLGAKGVISVLANMLPERTGALVHAALSGDIAFAAREQLALTPLIGALFSEVNPIPIKAALAQMGLCQADMRLPLVPMGDENLEVLKNEMRKLGVLA